VNNIKLLSLDQSTRLTGWCLMVDKKYNSSGVLSVNNTDDTIERMKLMYDQITDLINRVKPDVVLIEDTQFQNNFSSFRTLSQLQGIIMAYLFEKDLPFYIIPATAWKSYCKIKGKSRSEQKKNTQKYVRDTYGLDVSEDEADSIGIAVYGINNIN
jgi:crossover junction endodeoxyribonuclease RuvC